MVWYEYPTNYSNGTVVDGVGKFFLKYPDYILGGYYAMGWLLVIFLISFALGRIAGTKTGLVLAGFITSIFSIYFFRLGMVNLTIPIILFIVTIVGAIALKSDSGGSSL